jgi:plastocyanin
MRRVALAFLATLGTASARAEEPVTAALLIRDHRFQPAELHVPAGRPVLLRITNQDAEAEEFESSPLKVEKVIGAGQTLTVRLRPLAPGRFAFFGDYHPDTAQGAVIAEGQGE